MIHPRPSRTLHRLPLVAALLAVVALGGCATDDAAAIDGPSVEVSHAQGTTTVPLRPQRIVVFDMGVLDTVHALGGDVIGVPQDYLPAFLSEYSGDDYVDAGTLFEPDYEAVNEAQPDLIIVAERSAEALDDLSEIAPTIDLTLDPADFQGSFREQAETLATILEKEDEAEAALMALDKKVAEVKEQTENAGTGLVVLTTGGEVSAYGPGSRLGNVVHDLLGVEPADADITGDTHGEAVSFEYIAETNPDWLYVLDRDVATGESEGGAAQEVLNNDLVARTIAWQEGQVVLLDPERWYIAGSGLSTVDAMVSQIQERVR